jgi:NTP pyrophosphatase (non-canonical NTP hydrolase)
MSKINEILDLLQEECAEVIQAVSKCRRFGLDEKRTDLIQEIGDVTLLIGLLKAHGLYTDEELHNAEVIKSNKLTKWSTIYEN